MSELAAIDRLFLAARTHGHWLDRPVGDDVLRQMYDLARMPPTSANTQPMRLVFVRSAEAKEHDLVDIASCERPLQALDFEDACRIV